MPGKLLAEEFFRRAKEKFNNRFSYNEEVYPGWRGSIVVTCSLHDSFSITVRAHMESKSGGCHECLSLMLATRGRQKAPTFEEWVERCRSVHGDKYTYSTEDWTYQSKVKIICPIHGAFEQRASRHCTGNGCHDCSKAAQFIPFSEFLNRAHKVWGTERYEYDEASFSSFDTGMKIRCVEHDEIFTSTPYNHVAISESRKRESAGCLRCKGKGFATTFEDFVSRARETHGDKYRYSADNYSTMNSSAQVECPDHGLFTVKRAFDHVDGGGHCPNCPRYFGPRVYSASSKPELAIETLLEQWNIDFVREWSHKELRGIKGGSLRIDFAIESLKIFIEFDGPHHFIPFPHYHGGVSPEENLARTQEHDRRKNTWAKENGWTMIRLSDPKTIKQKLELQLLPYQKGSAL